MNEKKRKEQQEMLARFFHEDSWSHWMKYLFKVSYKHECLEEVSDWGGRTKPITNEGVLIINENVTRWKRQMNTAYDDLTEREKDSDRSIANDFRKYLTKHGYEVRKKDD